MLLPGIMTVVGRCIRLVMEGEMNFSGCVSPSVYVSTTRIIAGTESEVNNYFQSLLAPSSSSRVSLDRRHRKRLYRWHRLGSLAHRVSRATLHDRARREQHRED